MLNDPTGDILAARIRPRAALVHRARASRPLVRCLEDDHAGARGLPEDPPPQRG
jgi:hypothetical protein